MTARRLAPDSNTGSSAGFARAIRRWREAAERAKPAERRKGGEAPLRVQLAKRARSPPRGLEVMKPEPERNRLSSLASAVCPSGLVPPH